MDHHRLLLVISSSSLSWCYWPRLVAILTLIYIPIMSSEWRVRVNEKPATSLWFVFKINLETLPNLCCYTKFETVRTPRELRDLDVWDAHKIDKSRYKQKRGLLHTYMDRFYFRSLHLQSSCCHSVHGTRKCYFPRDHSDLLLSTIYFLQRDSNQRHTTSLSCV